MFVCPQCGANAHTRTSTRLSKMTIRQYHQCQNLECSFSFTTLNSVERAVTRRVKCEAVPEGFIPRDALPLSHYGDGQLSLAV
jgi:transcriptional regulator NrdR family protein